MGIDKLTELLEGEGYERRYLSTANYTYRKGAVEFRGDIDADGNVRYLTGWRLQGPRFNEPVLHPSFEDVVTLLAVATTHQYGATL